MDRSSNSSEKLREINNIFQRAEKLREQSLYPESIKLFRKALQNYKNQRDALGILHCSLSLGDTYRMIGNFDLASRHYTYSIECAKKIHAPLAVPDAQVGLGLSQRAQGKWEDALKLIRKARKTYKKYADKEGTAFTLWAEAGALRIKGDIIGAIKVYKESYSMFKALRDQHGAGYALCGLGGTSRIAGAFRESKKYYETANRLFSEQNDTFGKAYSFCGIGNAYRMLNDYKRALGNFAKATTLYKKIGDKVSYSYTLWGLGMTYTLIGNNRKARDFFIRSKKLFQKTKDPRGIIYCRLGLGQLSLIAGKAAPAKNDIGTSFTESINHGFRVEACHAKILLSFMNGKRDMRCYNKLGLKLRFQGLPLNIP
jgi:tetratricopeptide (TPR) repeat protein